MLVWLDGRTNTKAQPQENFGREIMELFTMGVGHYTEPDVYAGRARVHRLESGRARARRPTATQHYEFIYNAGQHDTASKTFSFAIYPDGSKTIPPRARGQTACRTASISSTALAANPNTGALPGGEAVSVLRQRVRRDP